VNGLSLLALIAIVVAFVAAYRVGRMHGRSEGPPLAALAGNGRSAPPSVPSVADVPDLSAEALAAEAPPPAIDTHAADTDVPASRAPGGRTVAQPRVDPDDPVRAARAQAIDAEKYRLLLSYEAESAQLRARVDGAGAKIAQLEELAQDRRRLYRELAAARTETARYRQVVVDIENDAPPPILGERGSPDDLKLIVGIGPVLERMLQQLGVATYRQIARWTEHDIDEMDARLPEFPGRIRRDTWVTQARELHQSKYGERP